MLDPEPDVGVMVECVVLCLVDIGGLQGDGFVAVLIGDLDAAIPVTVLYVCSAEDNQASFELLDIDEEGHGGFLSVQDLCISGL
jgi:hypothetical protein